MARDMEIVVADDPARLVAERLAEAATSGGSVVLTGGSTPRLAYEQAAKLAPDWSRVELWWSDERCVPADDERSNFGMAKRTLLDRLAVPPRAIHRIPGELGKDEAAHAYGQELGDAELDLLLLGLGSDGHVASLFPHQPTLQVDDRRVVGVEAKHEPYVDRVSLTLPTLRDAGEVLFLVTGVEKADAVAAAFAGDPDLGAPGSLVRSDTGRTWALIDPAAAAKL